MSSMQVVIPAGTSGNFPLTSGGDVVGRVRFMVQQASGGFSVTPTARVVEPVGAGTATVETNIPYLNVGTGAAVSAGTALTAAGLYEADVTGVRLSFNVGSVTTNALVVTLNAVDG